MGENKPVSLLRDAGDSRRRLMSLLRDAGDSGSPFRLGGPARKSGRFRAAGWSNFLGLAAQRYSIDPIKQQRLGDCEHRPRPRRRRRRSPGRDRLSQAVAAYLEEVGGRPEAMR